MKRTKSWWAKLTKQERSELVCLERDAAKGGVGCVYIADDCCECRNCSTPFRGSGGLCPLCERWIEDLVKKADRKETAEIRLRNRKEKPCPT